MKSKIVKSRLIVRGGWLMQWLDTHDGGGVVVRLKRRFEARCGDVSFLGAV
jgi:hypothetical protein